MNATVLVPLPNAGVDVFAQVDEIDAIVLSQLWCIDGYGYATCNGQRTDEGRKKMVRLHRVIAKRMRLDLSLEVDHVNGFKLDCRRVNLRSATRSDNARNQGPRSDSASGYKGVHFDARYKKGWIAQIRRGGPRYIGSFDSAVSAARAYDAAARALYGEFARLNFPVG